VALQNLRQTQRGIRLLTGHLEVRQGNRIDRLDPVVVEHQDTPRGIDLLAGDHLHSGYLFVSENRGVDGGLANSFYEGSPLPASLEVVLTQPHRLLTAILPGDVDLVQLLAVDLDHPLIVQFRAELAKTDQHAVERSLTDQRFGLLGPELPGLGHARRWIDSPRHVAIVGLSDRGALKVYVHAVEVRT
jgi:hypothetical protein